METFKTMVNGQEKEILVRSPKASEIKDANKHKSRAYWKAVKDGLPMFGDAAKMTQQTSWTPEKIAEYSKIQVELEECENILAKKRDLKLGGPTDKSENTMFRVALKCFNLRNKLIRLNTELAEAQEHTVEGYAENERLNYMLYCSTVYKDSGERVFGSYEEFDNSTVLSDDNAEKNTLVNLAFVAYQTKLVDSVKNTIDNNPENVFFKRFKFINNDGQFVDNNGNLVDSNGNKVIDEKPKLDKPNPYLDNDGNPIEDEEYKAELEKYELALAEQKTQKPNKT